MVSAGLPLEFRQTMRDPGYRPVSDWWPVISSYWDKVKHGSYAQAAIITARDLYDITEINDRTIEKLASCIMSDNKQGLYRRILVDRCKARAVLSNVDDLNFENDPYIKVVPNLDIIHNSVDSFYKLAAVVGRRIDSLNDLVSAACERLELLNATGKVVGFKSRSTFHAEPDKYSAEEVFKLIQAGELPSDINPLKDYLMDKLIRKAEQLKLPVALHAGIWGDFRTIDPKFTIYLAQRYPSVHFDLFHLGMPAARDAIIIGKNFRNVSLNLCWCPLISQKMTVRALDEAMDLVPINKVIAFGGDYRCVVQKAWGHLVMAREVIATVLADRIESGDITEERALDIAKMWFNDNPSEIYKV